MGKAFIKEETLTAIGNAIRAKTGETAAMLPSAMAGAIENMQTGGGSGSYFWTKQSMGESTIEDTTGGTYTLTTPNTTRPSTEIEYSTTAPTYNSTKRQWIFANPTVVTLSNSDATLPSISGNVYCRVTSEPNVWYLVSAFNKGSSSPYLKSMTYSKKITAGVNSVREYAIGNTLDEYPEKGWKGGYYFEKYAIDYIGGATNWVQNNNTSSLSFYYVHYSDGLWVACSGSNGLYYSTDGKNWTHSNVTSGVFYSVYYDNSLWVAGGNNGLYYSTDGKNWTQSNVTSHGFLVYYADGLWVAGVSGSNDGLYYSTDGKNWTRSNLADYHEALYYSNGIWVTGASSLSNGLYYSTDGKNWTHSNVTSGVFYSVYYDNSLWVAGGNNGLYYSTDGKNWTQSNVTNSIFHSVYYANGLWVASGSGIYYSTDGKVWTQTYNYGGYIVRYSNGVWFCGASTNSGIYYSTDGKSWAKSNIISGRFDSIYYGNGIWVAACIANSDTNKLGLYYTIPDKIGLL